ncbi:hypothetical protein A8L34_22550 [Bacillus sp. FJAT-27264]|uniref:GPW/gp25 family protein n=1 Tax=Paenibacillus sp. (strain DSM 101736 / FJAT-27264) TaxID=1850362 RepID=UPI000807B421|nr:GPW/gp25 family protein [Bacillus sp. FJAT-27264]OBZ08932.1 hypothetical protein A8L34_22550 [Bacillus sp. FJAT-27264]
MIYTVDMTKPSSIDFNPSLVDEIAQNIRTILSTPLGSAPLARNIGIDYDTVDDPHQIAVARVTSEIYAVIEDQEPRAQIVDVSVIGSLEDAMIGRLPVVISFTLAEGVE